MKNLSQFRKALSLGSRWSLEHANNKGVYSPAALRTVVHVQSNAVAFARDGMPYCGDPHKSASWLYFDGAGDKAVFWEFPDENTAEKYFKAVDGTPGRRADGDRLVYRRLV